MPLSSFRIKGLSTSMILHPSGQFLYVVQSPQTIQELSANSTTGDLTPGSATTASGADLRVATIDPSGKFLYATDLTGGRAFGYQIDPSSGSLTAIAGSPFTVASTLQPSIPVIDSTGHFLYVSLLTGIAAFAINGSTGSLTPVPGSPFSTASQPIYLATDPVGNFLYACTVTNGTIEGFAIDPTTGVLPSVGPPVDTTQFTSNIIVDPSGKFVYVSIESGSSIYGFSLNPVSGALSPLAGSPFASVANPTNLFIARF
jgi:6-phosphogluconolactonase (cycloisomerase 2 family)